MKTLKLTAYMFFLFIICFNGSAENKDTEEYFADAVVNDNNLRLRDQPGLTARIIGVLQKGDKVSILEKGIRPRQIGNMTSFWYYVDAGKKKGYCFGFFLDIKRAFGSPFGTPARIKDIQVSSYIDSKSRIDGHPQMALASRGSLAWIPEGDGIGAFYEIVMDLPTKTRGFRLFSSYDDERYYDYNRIKKIKIEINGNANYYFDAMDNKKAQEIQFEKEQTFFRMKLIILEVYKGAKYNTLPVSSISPAYIGDALWCTTVENLFSDPTGLVIASGTSMPSAVNSFFFQDGIYVKTSAGGGGSSRYIGTWKYDKISRQFTIIEDCEITDTSDGRSKEINNNYYHKTICGADSLFPGFVGDTGMEEYSVHVITEEDKHLKSRSSDGRPR